MKIFAIKGFHGHYPVGTAAIVVAHSQGQAINALYDKLTEIGLRQPLTVELDVIEIVPTVECVEILLDGNY